MQGSKIGAALLAALASNAFAANQSMLWGEPGNVLQRYQIHAPLKSMLKHTLSKSSDYQLTHQKLPGTAMTQHERYQVKYRGIPVWGYQMIFHRGARGKVTATGIDVSGIEKDVPVIEARLTPDEVSSRVLAAYKGEAVKLKRVQKVIFLNEKSKALLAYHVSFFTRDEHRQVLLPNVIVDANSGEVLKKWNGARKEHVGQGMGGNAFALPYRSGVFQHGEALPNLNSLGKFDVRIDSEEALCHVENESFRVMSLKNIPAGYGAFPITVDDEKKYQLKAYAYSCDALSQYINYSDGESGPMNYSFSPVNDTMYFAEQTLKMYQKLYGVKKPLGDDLPVRAYTHLGAMDNAFAIPSIIADGKLLAHQQIVIGNGDRFLTAPAQAVIGHELSHNVTAVYSNLIYDGQSGGLNESFSDMAAIALQDYVSNKHPWYWDGKDFSIGREAVIGGAPLRYMDDPTQDGMSIDNAADYHEGMEVHFSSGVFNKAFYLLSQKSNWGVQKAFQVMVDANIKYWSPIAYFDFAACGVIQSAADRNYDTQAVIDAFDEVGVHCPVPPISNM